MSDQSGLFSSEAYRSKLLPLKRREELHDVWLEQRLKDMLPALMRREQQEMWIVTSREYNDDPVVLSLTPAPCMSPRRRTLLVFVLKPGGELQRLNLSRYSFGPLYTDLWDPKRESQFDCLARVVREHDPRSIGLNYSDTFAFGDGLSHSGYLSITGALGPEYSARIRSAEGLAVSWLEQRSPAELTVFPAIVDLGHAIIAEAFSSRVVHPGITTTDDVVWWMREKMLSLGLEAWFQPTVDLQGFDEPDAAPGQQRENQRREPRAVIMPGDLLHCDMGFYYLGLATDQQELAYVLKPGETDAPEGLKEGLRAGNCLQDIHMRAMQVGKTGNQVLKDALEQGRAEGLEPMIYTHPLGLHGHAAGPLVGLWDFQDGVPGSGDYPVNNNTCYAVELNVKKAVAEWGGQMVTFALEQDAVMQDGRMRWLSGRQTEYHLIG